MTHKAVQDNKAKRLSDNWYAYCPICGKVLYECPNGNFADAAAKNHTEDTEHMTFVAYSIQIDN